MHRIYRIRTRFLILSILFIDVKTSGVPIDAAAVARRPDSGILSKWPSL
jgi:hypothetical protein